METISIESQAPGKLISSRTIHAVIDAIAKRFSPYRIILFGSYAMGAPTPDSDLDLLVVMETELPAYKRATPIRLIFDPSPCAMDFLVYTPKEVEYWNGTTNHIVTEILRRGKTVYEHRTE
ncbi:MAG: nucleotidyltransferase domain-containing protein [Terriglobia bacterium]